MKRTIAVLIAVLAYAQSAQSSEIANDPQVRRFFWSMMQDNRYGFTETEDAAFVVRREDGRIEFIKWSSETHHRATWRGKLPRGVIAIVHTHPNWIPNPSPTDARTAKLRRVPVYVVTRSHIIKTTGEATETVSKGDWKVHV